MTQKGLIGMWLLATLWVILSTAGYLKSEVKLKADRTPLTFRDSGLYCNLQFVHGHSPEEDHVTNLLTAKRAADPYTPWDFYIMQCNRPDLAEDQISILKEMAQNGKKVILRAHTGRLHKNPNVDEMEQWLMALFSKVDPDWLYAITLDEEHIYWHGWAEALAELYHRAKTRWPDLPVYQWWSPPVTPDMGNKSGWVALPADGWIMDLYGLESEEFEYKLRKFLETGKPLIHIAWASPTWPKFMGAESWEEGGRMVMDEQVRLCREYDVPVAYFIAQPRGMDEKGKKYLIRWGWHAIDPVVRKWFKELEEVVSKFDIIPEEKIGFKTVTAWNDRSSGPE